MRTLTKDENASLSRQINSEAKTVKVTHTVKESRDTDVRTELTWTFDFSKCSHAQILDLAERTIRIRMQAEWRKDKNKRDETKWDKVTFDVSAILAEQRKVKSDTEKADALLSRLTPEQIAALLEKHTPAEQ